MMRSRVAELAKRRGITTPSELQFAIRVSWPTAKQVWQGDLSKTRGETLRRLAVALKCSMDDLFIYEENSAA